MPESSRDEPPLPLPRRAPVVGVRVSVTDYDEVVRAVLDHARAGRRLLVAATDVHALMQARRDARFAAVLNAFDIVTPDGQPVRWGLRWTRQARLADRVSGPTLMLRICARAAAEGVSIFLYGSRAETLARLASRLRERFPGLRVAGEIPGRFRPLTPDEQAADAAAIRASGAGVLFVGMGCPRQEWWIFRMRERLSLPTLGVGAAFDLHAGLVRPAPPWMQDRGLEWAWRLTREPGRLWRRYVLVTPRYLPLIAAQALGLRRFPPPTDLAGADDRPCPG